MQNIGFTLHLRWAFWAIGIFLVLAFALGRDQKYRIRLELFSEKHFLKILGMVCGSFFALALLAKYSQLWTLSLNAQDFWLFVDILEQLKKGAAFLTRFAPQDIGYLQHGAIHPMFTWALLLPLAYLIGSVHAALVFNPFVMSLAGWMLGILTCRKWGAFAALLSAAAFLVSTQVGKILMYDVHPEAAYPFLVLLWLWAMGLDGSKRVRWGTLGFAAFFCVGVKEDSFLVFGPWVLWSLVDLRGAQRKAAVVSGVIALAAFCFQLLMVNSWVSGAWGPAQWQGSPVVTSAGLGLFKGAHWTSVGDIFKIAQNLISDVGGFTGLAKVAGSFLISRPWLSILVLAPWVSLNLRFWFLILPLALAYATLPGPRVLWNYYSAPFLATFWFCAVSPDLPRRLTSRYFSRWMIGAALLLGSGTIQLFWPSSEVFEIRRKMAVLQPCLGEHGIVESHLLGLVPLKKVWTDRPPRRADQWNGLDFVLFSPRINRFEMPREAAISLYQELTQMKGWNQIDESCQIDSHATMDSAVVLFVRK